MNEHPLFSAIEPLLQAIGGTVVSPREVAAGDIPLVWEGDLIGAVRVASLDGALDRIVGQIEDEFGAELKDMDRRQKQAAVRLLDERGAFLLRKSIDDVADMMGVSRITVYNYLAAIREPAR